MADAIQMYLDNVRGDTLPGDTVYIEKHIGEVPEDRPHPDFYGTVDYAAYGKDRLLVVDYKHGEGIVVEPYFNPQMMYYAYGIILARRNPNIRDDREVILRIVQPRAFHVEGPIREWVTTAGEIIHWAENELLPAMERAEYDVTLDPGKWCRFCPAKLFCPMLTAVYGAAAKADPNILPNFGQKRIGLEYAQREAVKFYLKALEDEVLRRNSLGNTVPGTKLVDKKANRIWDGSAPDLAKAKFAADAFTKPELKSPAELEKLGPAAKKFVQEHAYMPRTGLTVALDTDSKPEVKVPKSADIFAHLIEAGNNSDNS
jgi:hypothetical protein